MVRDGVAGVRRQKPVECRWLSTQDDRSCGGKPVCVTGRIFTRCIFSGAVWPEITLVAPCNAGHTRSWARPHHCLHACGAMFLFLLGAEDGRLEISRGCNFAAATAWLAPHIVVSCATIRL